MTPEAIAARNEYRRKWRMLNKEKIKEYNNRYWEKKGEKMKYSEDVKKIIEKAIERSDVYNADRKGLHDKFSREEITGKVYNAKLDEIEDDYKNDVSDMMTQIESIRSNYEKKVRAASELDGSMLHPDAKILEAPIELSQHQFMTLVEKHKNNPLMTQLLRTYQNKHENLTGCIVSDPEQKIRNFNALAETAISLVRNPEPIRAAMFIKAEYED